ncbi:amino-acid N-acetyltransferase [Agromyces archimandritae]|uniref:Amino-acid N-acetyltransferase n=1 Tax=Agromyces archimandritae TaxID=2781962 RepID=A0A975FPB9_9MICO|nr:amino-acid N-acetyltransferase [Agromyces archimandritae]QTX05549.1 amino-acid N-acetyltransferase [Agromyces archimandritae]
MDEITVRRARTSDVPAIRAIVDPLVDRRILLGKEWVELYGAVQEFRVAEAGGALVGFGALHVIWEDLGEVRTLAVADAWLGRGVGHRLLTALEEDARELGLSRLFCLTFETGFFGRHGFADMGAETVDPEVYAEIVRSSDDGIAEFLDLARVKQNTLGNTRMIKQLG